MGQAGKGTRHNRTITVDFQNEATSCYVNLQEKRKTLPLSGTSHRLTHFSLCTELSIGTPCQRSQASRLNHLLFEVTAIATPQVAYSFVTKRSCASHFQPCWPWCRHKEGNEVAVVTLFIPEREGLDP